MSDLVVRGKGVHVVSDVPFLAGVTWWHVLRECVLCVTWWSVLRQCVLCVTWWYVLRQCVLYVTWWPALMLCVTWWHVLRQCVLCVTCVCAVCDLVAHANGVCAVCDLSVCCVLPGGTC